MNCPKADKLSQYADNLLTQQENIQILSHLDTCVACSTIVKLFKEEQEFLKVNLQSPTLPDHFATLVLDQLEPYKQKDVRRKKQIWKRVLILAASLVLALSLTATFSPSFAQFIGGMFSTKEVDKGLNMAADEGLSERVDLEVSDQHLTFKVEDILVDSSRVALSLQVVNENGIAERPIIDTSIEGNRISVSGYNGEYNYSMGYRMDKGQDYNSFQVFISDEPGLEKVTITFQLVELNGKQGNWDIEIPVELTSNSDKTKNVLLDGATQTINGVTINLNEIQYAPTSNTLLYETSYDSLNQVEIEERFQAIKEQFGIGLNEFTSFGTSIKYHIEDEEKNVIMKFSPFIEEGPMDEKIIMSSGRGKGKAGHVAWKEVFVPEKTDSKLTFVLDGVNKVVPADFSVKFNPKKVKDEPVPFKYMGNEVTIKKAEFERVTNGTPTNFQIEMEVKKESEAAELGIWVLKDNAGKLYRMDNETSQDGKESFIRTIYFKMNGISDISEEMSLHLLSATSNSEMKDNWRVPLYK